MSDDAFTLERDAWRGQAAKLREAIRDLLPRHSGLCCVVVDGRLAVTQESCCCVEVVRNARALIGEWDPFREGGA